MVAGELLLKLLRRMHADIVNGVATGGSDTFILDSTLSGKYQANKFKNWIAIIKKTDDALSPQGKWVSIDSYVNTGAASFQSITDAVAAGDTYAFCKDTIPLYELLELMKDGLQALDKISYWDRSLSTADQTLRYTLPIAMKGSPIRSIRLEDAQYNQFEVPNYYMEANAGGVSPTLVFKSQPMAGYTLAINYITLHPELTAYNSYISEDIHPELAVSACFERAMWWKCQPKRRKIDMENWGQAKALLQEAMMNHPIPKPIVENQRVPIGIFN